MKKKSTKQIMPIIFTLISTFVLTTGCNFNKNESTSTSNSNNTSNNSTIKTNYKIGDYLNSVKASYSVSNLSSETQNTEIQEYKDQILALTQMLAADTIVGLLQQYAINNVNNDTEYLLLGSSTLRKQISSSKIPYSKNISNITELGESNSEKNEQYKYDRTGFTFGGDLKVSQWMLNDYFDNSIVSFIDYYDILFVSKVEIKHKLTYAILSIIDKFNNTNEDDFDTTYKAFLNDYDVKDSDTSTDFAKLSENLAFNVKHSGLYPNSLESKAFKQFILDRVIGEELVKKDNKLFQVFDEKTMQYINISSSSTEKFRGETFYYNPNATYTDGEVNDISLFINGSPDSNNITTCDQINERLKQIYDATESSYDSDNVKLWQDIDNDNKIEFSENIGNVAKSSTYINGNLTKVDVPKYRALVGFRNYDYTVEKIIDMVLTDTTNKIQIKDSDNNYHPISSDTNYPVVANVFSKNYSYTDVELKGNTSNCKLPKQAYKSALLAMKDRTNMSIKNNLGKIDLLLEGSANKKVNVSVYARYYRKGNGFAHFENGDNLTTFYKFPNASGEVGESNKVFELEFEDLFKSAKFKTANGSFVSNNQTFDYTYKDKNQEPKTTPIYEIKSFPEDYTKSTDISHASIYTSIDSKANPAYEEQCAEGKNGGLYAYNENNLSNIDGKYEFIELVFATDNDNPFTFGFTNFIPQTEFKK